MASLKRSNIGDALQPLALARQCHNHAEQPGRNVTMPFAVLPESPFYSMSFCAIVEEVQPLTRAAEALLNLLLEARR
jgi:hypothetical protein